MVCTDSVICSVANGVYTADSVCAHLLRGLLLGSIFLNSDISIKSTQIWYMYSFMAQAGYRKKKKNLFDFQVLQYA